MQQCGHAGFGAADGQAGEPLAGLQKLEARGAGEAMILAGQALGDLMLRFGNQFGGGGGGGGAQVGDEIGDGEVGLVAYRGDDGEAARCDRAGDALAVEGGQVFERASAAGQDNHVREAR